VEKVKLKKKNEGGEKGFSQEFGEPSDLIDYNIMGCRLSRFLYAG
jgi:hypothetical protein